MKRNFQVGDRVRAVENTPRGKEGIVIAIERSNFASFLVEFENWQDGHDGHKEKWREPWYPPDRRTPSQSRWYCIADMLELVERAETARKISGNGIRVISDAEATKEIRIRNGNTMRVYSQRPGEYFREGDIIFWSGNGIRYSVLGFNSNDPRELWVMREGSSSDCGFFDYRSVRNLFLVKREGYRFEAGNEVIVRNGSSLFGKRGRVVLIDPEKNYRYLVEFPGEQGSERLAEWNNPWFPEKYTNTEFLRVFLEEHELEKI